MKSVKRSRGNSGRPFDTALLSSSLTSWYLENRRPLPWRASQDPYRIWISEIMLQQTTVQAVIPYYERFLKAFPDVHSLARAPLEKVLELWSGLGYYLRARNLHRAAELFSKNGFPRTAAELQEFPGLGPYTSRAVASIAFEERVGVLDGNVIRILSRVAGLPAEHWKPAGRHELQVLADELAQVEKPSNLNQAMMELGATICTTQSPICLLCPWNKECLALKSGMQSSLPLKKPRAEFQTWIWQPEIYQQGGRVALVQNPDMPFLKGQWVFPGEIRREEKRPETFDLKHGITHHDIYIQIQKTSRKPSLKDVKWCNIETLSSVNPSILLTKVLSRAALSSSPSPAAAGPRKAKSTTKPPAMKRRRSKLRKQPRGSASLRSASTKRHASLLTTKP